MTPYELYLRKEAEKAGINPDDFIASVDQEQLLAGIKGDPYEAGLKAVQAFQFKGVPSSTNVADYIHTGAGPTRTAAEKLASENLVEALQDKAKIRRAELVPSPPSLIGALGPRTKGPALPLEDTAGPTLDALEESVRKYGTYEQQKQHKVQKAVSNYEENVRPQLLASILDIPADILATAGLAVSLPELGLNMAEDVLPKPVVDVARKFSPIGGQKGGARALIEKSQELTAGVNRLLGIDYPKNTAEMLARIGPAAALPVPSGTKLRKLFDNPLARMVEYATPLTIGPSRNRILANVGIQTGAADVLYNYYNPDYSSWMDSFTGEAAKYTVVNDSIRVPNVTAIPTLIGETAKNIPELKALGYVALASIGLAFVPKTTRMILQGSLNPLPVTPVPIRQTDPTGLNVHPYVGTNTTLADIIGTQLFSPDFGLTRIAQKLGATPELLQHIRSKISLGTGSGASYVTDQYFTNGFAVTTAGALPKRRPMQFLSEVFHRQPPEVQDVIQRYTLLKDSLDRFNQKKPPATVRGLTPKQIKQQLALIEQAYPNVAPFFKAILNNIDNVHMFSARGEYAVRSIEETRHIRKAAGNSIPVRTDLLFGKSPWEKLELIKSSDPRLEKPVLSKTGKRSQAVGNLNTPHLPVTESAMDYIGHEIQVRLRNEAVGSYIDNLRSLPEGKRIARRLGPKESRKLLKANPQWRPHVVSFYRRGKKEVYLVGDRMIADILKFDPAFLSSDTAQVLYRTKRAFEAGTTGILAPWFAFTQALREPAIGKVTHPPGTVAPKYRGVAQAVVEQITARTAQRWSKSLRESIDVDGVFSRTFGKKATKALSDRLGYHYRNSLLALIDNSGNYNAALLEQQWRQTRTALDKFLSSKNPRLTPAQREGLAFWRTTLYSAHNAARYDFFKRNKDAALAARKPAEALGELSQQTMKLTGDLTTAGVSHVRSGGKTRPIRFNTARPNVLTAPTASVVGGLAQFTRTGGPWANAMIKGMYAIGHRYWQNPAQFTSRVWATLGVPAVAEYAWNASLGPEYTEYMMEQRSAYNQTMFWYIGLPGVAPENGLHVPKFHEGAIYPRLVTTALDSTFRPTRQLGDTRSMYMDAFNTWAGIVAVPAAPPIASALGGTVGMALPQGPFGGEAYKPRKLPDDPRESFSVKYELVSRALLGGLADVIGQSYAAFTHTPDGLLKAIKNGAKEAGLTVAAKAPVFSDLLQLRTMSANTPDSIRYYRYKDDLDVLLENHAARSQPGRRIHKDADASKKSNRGTYATGDRSVYRSGEPVGDVPNYSLGIPPEPPTNPLYNEFIDHVVKNFENDTSGTLKGFETLTKHMGRARRIIRDLRFVNEGSLHNWQQGVLESPETMNEMLELGIDPTKLTVKDARRLRNEMTKRVQEITRVLIEFVMETESQLSEKYGRPIKLKDLKPFGTSNETAPPLRGAVQ